MTLLTNDASLYSFWKAAYFDHNLNNFDSCLLAILALSLGFSVFCSWKSVVAVRCKGCLQEWWSSIVHRSFYDRIPSRHKNRFLYRTVYQRARIAACDGWRGYVYKRWRWGPNHSRARSSWSVGRVRWRTAAAARSSLTQKSLRAQK